MYPKGVKLKSLTHSHLHFLKKNFGLYLLSEITFKIKIAFLRYLRESYHLKSDKYFLVQKFSERFFFHREIHLN